MSQSFDAIVIGSGQAGPFLAVDLANAGLRTALIEREHFGGTCVNDGCIPTKTLIASARAAHIARRAAEFGIRVDGPVQVDMAAVKARKDQVVGHSIASLTRWLCNTENLRVVWGHARFVARGVVDVCGEQLSAEKIFINVGGRPRMPDWPGLAEVPVLTNTSMMAIDALPQHLVVIGGSYVGLEFAQMYRRFGAQVTVLETGDRLITHEDADVSREVQAILAREGITFHFSVHGAEVSRGRGGARIMLTFESARGAQQVDATHLLSAVGRRPNTDDLGLERAGVATDAAGFIVVDEQLRTNVAGIWALGDVNGRGGFTHTAYNDYEIVAANLLHGQTRRLDDRISIYALFTDPPLGRVGLTEAEALATGLPVLVATLPMCRVGRARERGETQGFMKIIVDARTERILGAALLGANGDEIVHVLLALMATGASYRVLQRTVLIHPTIGEMLPSLLARLQPPSSADRSASHS